MPFQRPVPYEKMVINTLIVNTQTRIVEKRYDDPHLFQHAKRIAEKESGTVFFLAPPPRYEIQISNPLDPEV